MADSKIQIEVEVIGADKATKQLEKVEKQSVDIKEGVKGVGESFKSVGDLVSSQGGLMGEAFGTLGDSVIGITDSIAVFKDGMATAGATGAKAWLGLLGPIAMVVSAVALAVEAYRTFSGSMQEAEDNAENMAAAASDTASRLEAMVENGIVLSTNALKEFIQVNERARLRIEESIKINEKRSKVEQELQDAIKRVKDAEESYILTSVRTLLAKDNLNQVTIEYNKQLEKQVEAQNKASKAQKEAYELEQLLTNEVDFFVDELKGEIDTYADLQGEIIKATDVKKAENVADLVSASTKKKYYEQIRSIREAQVINNDLLSRGVITQKAYDEAQKALKQSLKATTDELKESNKTLDVQVKLNQANSDITKANTELTKKNNVVVGSGISLAERRIANYENINRIEKEYLANLSNELKIETILKEVVIGGSNAVVNKRNKEIEQITNLMDLKHTEYETTKKEKEAEIEITKKQIEIESKIYEEKKKGFEDISQFFKDSNEKRFQDFNQMLQDEMDTLKFEFEDLKREIPSALQEIDDARKKSILEVLPSINKVYKEYYKNLVEIARVAYDVEMKDLNEQEFKLKQSKKKNKDELLNIEKKKVLAEQNFIAEQSKIQLQFEQDFNNSIINIQKERLDKSLELNKENLEKQLIELDLSNSKIDLNTKKSFDKKISDFKQSRSAFLSLFIDENKLISDHTEKFNKYSELNTLATEKEKIEIERKSQEDRLNKLKEFTNETGKLNEVLKRQTEIIFKDTQLKMAQDAYKLASENRKKTMGEIEDLVNLSQEYIDSFTTGDADFNRINDLFRMTQEELKGVVDDKGIAQIEKYRKKWEEVTTTFDNTALKMEDLTDEKGFQSGYYENFGFDVQGISTDAVTALQTLREKYKIDPSKDIADQVNKLREGYQTEVEALQISLEQKKLLIDDYNMKINKSNEEKANKDIETSKMEYSTVRGMLYDMTDAYAQSASANIATAFYQGESIKEALKNTLQSLAIESTSKAIYETAAGFASLAIPGMQTSSALHFKAAAMYGSVALLAGVGTKLAPPSGGGATAPTTPTGSTQGISQARSPEDKGQVQNFYINFGGAVIYDTKKSAEMAMAERVIQLGMSSRRGFNPPIDNRNGR